MRASSITLTSIKGAIDLTNDQGPIEVIYSYPSASLTNKCPVSGATSDTHFLLVFTLLISVILIFCSIGNKVLFFKIVFS